MKIFRTTINFDQILHRQLSVEAAAEGISLSELVNRILSNKNTLCEDKAKESYEDDLKFFRAMRKKGRGVDWVKALRNQRNRDND